MLYLNEDMVTARLNLRLFISVWPYELEDPRGGPLDLLGVEPDGRLNVFELKRGTLSRDAVAQVIDYSSDLEDMDAESLYRHIAEESGNLGVQPIGDFEEWPWRRRKNSTDSGPRVSNSNTRRRRPCYRSVTSTTPSRSFVLA